MFQPKAVEKIKTHILCSITFFLFENRVVYEIVWENIAQSGKATDDNIIWRTRTACWITNATNTP